MHVNGNNRVSFCSSALQLRELDKLNRQFCLAMKDFSSSTKFDAKIDSYCKTSNNGNLAIKTYEEISKKIFKNITQLREEFNKMRVYTDDKDYKLLAQLVKKYKVANCREMVELLRHNLISKGIDCHRVGLNIGTKDYQKTRMASDHVFLVVNMKKDAKFEKPSTWGSNAIIVDPWAQSVSYASEGIEKLKNTFNLDESYEFFKFFRVF